MAKYTKEERKERRSRAMRSRHQDPAWRKRWALNNALGKRRAKLLREQASASPA